MRSVVGALANRAARQLQERENVAPQHICLAVRVVASQPVVRPHELLKERCVEYDVTRGTVGAAEATARQLRLRRGSGHDGAAVAMMARQWR